MSCCKPLQTFLIMKKNKDISVTLNKLCKPCKPFSSQLAVYGHFVMALCDTSRRRRYLLLLLSNMLSISCTNTGRPTQAQSSRFCIRYTRSTLLHFTSHDFQHKTPASLCTFMLWNVFQAMSSIQFF